jgi:hypothetical protein
MIDNFPKKEISPPKTFDELVERLKEIKEIGYVRTHRAGPTGIGKTLEDLLGIKENNVIGPDAVMLELKSARKNSKSMITLITKSPLPEGANIVLLEMFGYPYPTPTSTKKALHTTLKPPPHWTTVRGKKAFRLNLADDRIELISTDEAILAYWTEKSLEEIFKKKYPHGLVFVKAECRGRGKNEEFWFNEAWLLREFNFAAIKHLIAQGIIRVDIRIGQYPDGRPHDHGTGFRVFEEKFDLCFKDRKRLV